MELFSKRYTGGLRRIRFNRRGLNSEESDKFLPDTLRNRLLHEFQYIVQSNDYLESFLIVHDQPNSTYHVHSKSLQQLSLRELGYDLTENINCKNLCFQNEEYEDAKFFDMIELLMIFTKDERRDEVCKRINRILLEEDETLSIHGYMIIDRSETGLRSITPLIKENLLKKKLNEFYDANRMKPDYQSLARISADILQFLCSSPKGQGNTKIYSEELCNEIALKWTTPDHVDDFKNLLSENIKNAKLLSNQIENIRHTDKSSIPVDHPNFYKLITMENTSTVELVILSLPEKYIMDKDPSDAKKEYLSKYKIDPSIGWHIKKKVDYASEIKPEDLPF